MKKFILVIFIFGYYVVCQKTVLAKTETVKKSNSKIEFAVSRKEIQNNYQTKGLVEFVNYNSKYFKTTEAFLKSAIILSPSKRERYFLFRLKKSLFKKTLYLSQFKYLEDSKIQILSKKDGEQPILIVKDFEKGLYIYEGRLAQLDWTESIEENLLTLAKKLKPAKKTLITPIGFLNELIFPSAQAVAPAVLVSLIKSAFSVSRLKDIALWMLSFQTMRVCQEDHFSEDKYKPSAISTCVGSGLLWPFYWGFKLSKIGKAFADETSLQPKSEIDQFIKMTNISCPQTHQKEKQMVVSFSGSAVFLDVTVNYDEYFKPVNVVISEGKAQSKKEDSIKIFINRKWEKQAVKKLKEESYFEVEESILLKSAQSFSDFCKKNPKKAENSLKKMIKNTQFSISPQKEGNSPKAGAQQTNQDEGRR
ncbi:MAG: hypothetical protein OXJ52_02445 [Oligoflexia bacterium]|nr:hypothetical protein [Oligoflexia bacterium]